MLNSGSSELAYATESSLIGKIKYSGHVVDVHGPESYTPLLSHLQDMVERVAFLPASGGIDSRIETREGEDMRQSFNHVMLNRYANGNEYIGKHRDTKENKVGLFHSALEYYVSYECEMSTGDRKLESRSRADVRHDA